jgi:tRNA modification GTPase
VAGFVILGNRFGLSGDSGATLMLSSRETIFALSSGSVPSGVAVIRLSGPQVADVLTGMIGTLPIPRIAELRTIRTRNGQPIDSGLVIFFPAPRSFTGEDCAEFQVHGGQAVVKALYDELKEFGGVRTALPGEFSRRAFENAKLDLVEIEGLADLIAAETEMQRRLAVEQSSGRLSRQYDSWAERLTKGRALIEAELDFADEDDVPGSVSETVWADMSLLQEEISLHLSDADAGEIIRDGFKVVIAGAPNAGKSSLMNALARREVAIVTDIAGTTRDILQVDLNIDGFLVKLYDTAGLRLTEEPVEKEGIRRARDILAQADLRIYVEDVSAPDVANRSTSHEENLFIGTKGDLPQQHRFSYDLIVSSKTGVGLGQLRALISDRLKGRVQPHSLAIPTRARHRDSLAQCLAALEMAVSGRHLALDLRAEELRLASTALGRITGRVDVENLLDIIFSEFCIGK